VKGCVRSDCHEGHQLQFQQARGTAQQHLAGRHTARTESVAVTSGHRGFHGPNEWTTVRTAHMSVRFKYFMVGRSSATYRRVYPSGRIWQRPLNCIRGSSGYTGLAYPRSLELLYLHSAITSPIVTCHRGLVGCIHAAQLLGLAQPRAWLRAHPS
jgi:hypothetical protein